MMSGQGALGVGTDVSRGVSLRGPRSLGTAEPKSGTHLGVGAVAIFLAKHGYVIIPFTISNNMESGFSQTHQGSSAYGGIGLLGAPLGARDEAFGHKIPVVRPQGYDTEHRHVRTQKNNVF